MNELDKFLDGLGDDKSQDIDILEQPLTPPEPPQPEADDEDEEDDTEVKARNRRERRLLQRLEDERNASRFLAEKLEAVASARQTVDEEADYLKAIERIYGTETPEALMATELLKKAMVGVRDDAEQRAYQRYIEEREMVSQAEAQASEELDSYIDEIEDTYGVTLTADQERSYFMLLEKMSPKDRDGNVIGYADPHAVWEVFQERSSKRGSSQRAKQLSSRSMLQTNQTESKLEDDTSLRFLRENGII